MRRRTLTEAGEYDRMTVPQVFDMTRSAPDTAHMGWANEQARMVAGTMLKGICPICREKVGRGIVGHVTACRRSE